jgi:hypothetical protein
MTHLFLRQLARAARRRPHSRIYTDPYVSLDVETPTPFQPRMYR